MDFVQPQETGNSSKASRKTRPHINRDVIVQLWQDAGGRCSFPNCCEPLAWNTLTQSRGNFSNIAHNVAWIETGPRGNDPLPINKRNDLENLLLVCRRCHKEIDDDKLKSKYPVDVLRKYKKDHEENVSYMLSLLTKKKTAVVTFAVNVLSATPTFVFDDIFKAVSPRVPRDLEGIAIRFTEMPGQESDSFYETYAKAIEAVVNQRIVPLLMNGTIDHLSILALAPIPLLMKLGSAVSNKVPTRLFQRHRSSESWTWPEGNAEKSFEIACERKGTDKNKVALFIEVSGAIANESVPSNIDGSFSIYKVKLKSEIPSTVFLKYENTLEEFKEVYSKAIATIKLNHLGIDKIHFFPAVPAPIAVLCGRELLPKADPTLIVYDFNKKNAQFKVALEIN